MARRGMYISIVEAFQALKTFMPTKLQKILKKSLCQKIGHSESIIIKLSGKLSIFIDNNIAPVLPDNPISPVSTL